jgi:carotenoid cleavage dioxygenase-like enzyme
MALPLRHPPVLPDPLPADLEAARADRGLLFRSLVDEVTDVPLRVRGRLPEWLGGTLVRNGPALFELERQRLRHWFDGQAMLHAFAIADGRVRYTNRFVRGRALRANLAAGRLRYREFATDPCHALFARCKALFDPAGPGGVTDNAAVSVVRLGRHVAALTEGALPVTFDPATLETLGVVGWDGRRDPVREPQITTAHPHVRADGTLVNFTVRFGRHTRYEVFVADPVRGTVRTVAALPAPEPAYLHSFGLTATTAVLAEAPWTVRLADVLLSPRPFAELYRWRAGRPARFHLVDLAGTRAPVTLEAPPFFTFHHVNAYDDGDAVVAELVAYDDAAVVDALYLDALRDARPLPRGRLQRWRLPRAGGEARLEAEWDAGLELPRIHPEHDARRHRHVYGAGASEGAHFLDRVMKVDVARDVVRTWGEPRCYPGEPVFVPRPGGRHEDDGVVLTLVLDAARGRSALVVLDARTLDEVARAEAPHAVPAGFHGEFLADAPPPDGEHTSAGSPRP